MQLGLSHFLTFDGLEMAAWRWVLLALGIGLAFGGGILPSVAVGATGSGAEPLLGFDAALGTLMGAAAFLTVTLNVPVAAALLAVAWGGDSVLPAALLAAGLAHALSGESSLAPAQARSRARSALPSGPVAPEWLHTPRRRRHCKKGWTAAEPSGSSTAAPYREAGTESPFRISRCRPALKWLA
ncbi:hypothetical protein ACFP81_03900 [Deinococcus lacus]|uniref:Uncharacterized protein n=1 Tax=Deinococcus lacus TaxID=392561 RepID=A0ABW1YCT4_9DEIO